MIKNSNLKNGLFFNFPHKNMASKLNFENKKLKEVLSDSKYNMDEITASDLLTNDFKESFDQTITSCGESLFDYWIHSIKTKEQIKNIQNDMQKLSAINKNKITDYLKKYVGKQNTGNFIRDIWNGFSISHWIIKNYYPLELLNYIFLISLSILFPAKIFLFAILFFMFNMIMYFFTNKHINHITSSVGYFFNLIHVINKIDKKVKDFPTLSIEKPNVNKFKRIEKYYLFFKKGIGGPDSSDLISTLIDYWRIFLGMELFAFKRTEHRILANIEDVRKVYLYVGYIDLLFNNLNIMDEYETCFSKIVDEEKINFEELNHPLVENSISQTKNINSNFIITGLNMSGKTTFMKSLGLNQLLATSFGFAFAKKYECPVLDILSSICINDELLKGKSRYYAEAERLIEIKEKIKEHKCLCLIDEILSGTNSDERIFGSTKILNDFANYNSILIAATHDIQIAQSLEGKYKPIYFDGEIEGDKIIFDYVIKDGIVSKRNGLLILKLLGI